MFLRLILSLSILLIIVEAAPMGEDDPLDFIKRHLDPSDFRKMNIPMLLERYKEAVRLTNIFNTSGLPYKAALNKFALYSGEQLGAMLRYPQKCSTPLKGNHNFTEAAVPDTKDWREDGIVSPVKEQGISCASGWAFSATGALEAAYHQAFGKGISLSEQQLIDCGRLTNPYYGCGGGLPSHAFEYIKYNGGIATRDNYPYEGKRGRCKFQPEDVAVKVLNSVNITQGSEDELKHAVGLVRPVTVTFTVTQRLLFYKEGVFTDSMCYLKQGELGSAGLVVGYGVENGIPYWLVKNSWGSNWGENGYFKIERGKNMCGIESCASYPVVA